MNIYDAILIGAGHNSLVAAAYLAKAGKKVLVQMGSTANRHGRIIGTNITGGREAFPGVAGTMWGALNAVNEYLAYERGSSDEGRLQSLWFGDSARLNQRALQVAMQMTG